MSKATYWYGKGHPKYGDILKIKFPNGSRIYVTTKRGITITVPKRIMQKQLRDKKRKDIEIWINPAEITVLYKAMNKTIFKK